MMPLSLFHETSGSGLLPEFFFDSRSAPIPLLFTLSKKISRLSSRDLHKEFNSCHSQARNKPGFHS
jgi:hypothetical protein